MHTQISEKPLTAFKILKKKNSLKNVYGCKKIQFEVSILKSPPITIMFELMSSQL